MSNRARTENRNNQRTTKAERRSAVQERRFNKRNETKAVPATVIDLERAFVPQPLKVYKPKTIKQKEYVCAIKANEVTFSKGPAGTGKTLMAVVEAAELLNSGAIDKIIVTRPVVNVENEELGFLPGELDEKYAPYFRPVQDAFERVFGKSHLENLIRLGKIEAMPMALMRGMSVRACIIADEMQNATYGQLKMLLTRGEEGTKFIINGDTSQIDLEPRSKSGLQKVINKLKKLSGVAFVEFTDEDIVRSGLTQRIARVL